MTVVFEITTQEQIKAVMDALIKATPDTKIKIEEQETKKPAKDPEEKSDKEPKEVKFVPIDKVTPKKKRTNFTNSFNFEMPVRQTSPLSCCISVITSSPDGTKLGNGH